MKFRFPFLILCFAAAVFAWLVTSGGTVALICAGIDWADHLEYIETFYLDRGTEVTAAVATGMGHYPPMAHWLCASVSRWLDLPPPRTLQLFCAALGFVGCALVAFRAGRLVKFACEKPLARFWAFLILVVAYGILTYLGLGIFGHLAFNFFYAQFCGTVAALVGLQVLRHRRLRNPYLGSIFLHLAGVAITCTHLLPGLWFYGAAFLTGAPWARGRRSAIAYLLANGAVAGLSLWLNPYVFGMVKTSSNNGDFVLRTGIFSSTPILLIIFFSSISLVAALGVAAWLRLGHGGWIVLIRHHAGLLSIVGLLLLNGVVFLTSGFSSAYSLKKYLMILAIETPLGLMSLVTLLAGTRSMWLKDSAVPGLGITSLRLGRYSTLTSVAYIALIAAQIPFSLWGYDQLPLLYYRETLLSQRYQMPPAGRAYPQSPQLHSIANYYLATGILGIPRDARTLNWLVVKGGQGEVDLPLLTATLPRAWYWHTVGIAKGAAPGPGQKFVVSVHWPYANHFLLARTLPCRPGEVALGVKIINRDGIVVAEDRGILVQRSGWHNEDFEAVLPNYQNRADVERLTLDLVQEGVLWFGERNPGGSSALVVSGTFEKSGVLN